MRTVRTTTLVFGLAVALGGCSGRVEQAPTPRKSHADVERELSAAPERRTITIDGNQLLVIDVPQRIAGTDWLEFQRCFIWRDAEYRSATLSCPHEPADDPATDTSGSSSYSPEDFSP